MALMRMMFLLMTLCLVASAQLATKRSMTLAAAKQIAAAAEAEAAKNHWNVVIAILDDGANLVYLQRWMRHRSGASMSLRRRREVL